MSVRFVIGRAGAGKTDWCFNQIVAHLRARPMGPPIYWLLPRQATFQAERDLVCRGGLDGFFRARVLSLDELAREILDAASSTIVPRITDKGRRLIFAHLLRVHRDRLRFFASVAHFPGMAGQLDAVLSELHRKGTDVQEAATNLDSASDPAPPGLATKFHDIALLHNEYLRFIGDQRLDPERRMSQAVSAVADSTLLRDAIVFIDAFDDFTYFERRFVTAVAQAASDTSITFLMDTASPLLTNPHNNPDEAGIFHRTETNYRLLWISLHQAAIAIDKPVLLSDQRRLLRPELDRLEKSLHDPQLPIPSGSSTFPSPCTQGEGQGEGSPAVEFHEAHDRRAELNLAARKIRDLSLAGLRYRDIALLVRDLSTCGDLIHSTLAEHNIPCFIDQRRSAVHHPLPRLLRRRTRHLPVRLAPFRGHERPQIWPLLDIPPGHADELENHVLSHGIIGPQWTRDDIWSDAPPNVQSSRRRLIEIFSPLVSFVTAQPQQPVAHFARAFIEFLDRSTARIRLAEWIDLATSSGQREQAEEHRQAWAECCDLLQQLVELMPDVSMPLDEFAAIAESALDELDLALAPQTVDEVLVGSIDRTRTPAIKVAIVMGLSEGIFPRPAATPRVLTDPDRRSLAVRGINVDPDSRQMALEEKFLGYQAFTRASQRLILTRPRTDDRGRPLKPSSLWQHARETLGHTADPAIEQDDQADAISTPRQLIATLAQWARDDASLAAQPADPRPATYQWLAGRQPSADHDDPIDTLRSVAWKSLTYSNIAALESPLAHELLATPRDDGLTQVRLTSRDITSFRNCRFQHFCQSALHLSNRPDAKLGNRRIGSIYRRVLDDALEDLLHGHTDWTTQNQTQLKAIIDRALDRIASKTLGNRITEDPTLQYRLNRLRQSLDRIVRSQREFSLAGHFRPIRSNVSFGDEGEIPPVTLPISDGLQLHISGHIDRIDAGLPDAAGVRPAVALTYKLGARAPDMAMVFQGRDVELLILLLALAGAQDTLDGQTLVPAAALAVPTAPDIRGVPDPDKVLPPDDPKFWLAPKPRGLINGDVFRQFDKDFPGGSSDVVSAYIKKDGNPGFPKSSDLAEPDQLDALLEHVRQCLIQAADQMLRGDIAISPYMRGTQTPCPQCQFHDVCRIERGDKVYAHIEPMDRPTALDSLPKPEK